MNASTADPFPRPAGVRLFSHQTPVCSLPVQEQTQEDSTQGGANPHKESTFVPNALYASSFVILTDVLQGMLLPHLRERSGGYPQTETWSCYWNSAPLSPEVLLQGVLGAQCLGACDIHGSKAEDREDPPALLVP